MAHAHQNGKCPAISSLTRKSSRCNCFSRVLQLATNQKVSQLWGLSLRFRDVRILEAGSVHRRVRDAKTAPTSGHNFRKVLQQSQPGSLTFLGMKLHRKQIVAPHARAKRK
jgi:hypothetical protein